MAVAGNDSETITGSSSGTTPSQSTTDRRLAELSQRRAVS